MCLQKYEYVIQIGEIIAYTKSIYLQANQFGLPNKALLRSKKFINS